MPLAHIIFHSTIVYYTSRSLYIEGLRYDKNKILP